MPDPRDLVLQQQCPTIMVPKFDPLAPLVENGHRFLVASDGLWIEIRRSWLHCVVPVCLVCRQETYLLPYGNVSLYIDFAFGKINSDLMVRFVADAKAALPNEFGAFLVYDERTNNLSYLPLESSSQGPTYLNTVRPLLGEHESLVVDLHSHGVGSAEFSFKDNEDDSGEVKISGVVGKLGTAVPQTKFRLCTGGGFYPLNGNLEGKI